MMMAVLFSLLLIALFSPAYHLSRQIIGERQRGHTITNPIGAATLGKGKNKQIIIIMSSLLYRGGGLLPRDRLLLLL